MQFIRSHVTTFLNYEFILQFLASLPHFLDIFLQPLNFQIPSLHHAHPFFRFCYNTQLILSFPNWRLDIWSGEDTVK